ncbi:Bacteriophage Lambda NinG protein [compost metagenome]
MKPKRCKSCRESFIPARPLQSACGVQCAIELTNAGKEKARKAKEARERAEHRQAKEKVKTRNQWLADAQAIVNRYVRLRDAHLGCVSCDKPATWEGQWHASHLRSVGAASTVRFNLWNIHKSCSICNNHLSGNLIEFLPRARLKIGDEKIEWLYQQNQPVSYSIDYLKRLKTIFAKKCRMLERRRQCG